MSTPGRLALSSALVLFAAAASAGEPIYRSVDRSGHLTYSDAPPADAVRVEDLRPPEGPGPDATREAIDRADRLTDEANAGYEAIMERRRQEAAARQTPRPPADGRPPPPHPDQSWVDDGAPVYVIPPWQRHHHHRPPPGPPGPPRPPKPPKPPKPQPSHPQLRAYP